MFPGTSVVSSSVSMSVSAAAGSGAGGGGGGVSMPRDEPMWGNGPSLIAAPASTPILSISTPPASPPGAGLVANVLTAGQMAAMVQSVTIAPNRIVTTSGAFTTTTADANGSIGLNRTSSPSNSTTTLPSGAVAGQTYTYDDLSANSQTFPITINAPAGMSIAGLSQVVLNTNRGRASFTYYGSNIWSVKF